MAALATNMRFVIYGAATRRWLTQYSARRRSFLGYISGDFSFVLFMNRLEKEGAFAHRDAWLFGVTALANWLIWQVALRLPASWVVRSPHVAGACSLRARWRSCRS